MKFGEISKIRSSEYLYYAEPIATFLFIIYDRAIRDSKTFKFLNRFFVYFSYSVHILITFKVAKQHIITMTGFMLANQLFSSFLISYTPGCYQFNPNLDLQSFLNCTKFKCITCYRLDSTRTGVIYFLRIWFCLY